MLSILFNKTFKLCTSQILEWQDHSKLNSLWFNILWDFLVCSVNRWPEGAPWYLHDGDPYSWNLGLYIKTVPWGMVSWCMQCLLSRVPGRNNEQDIHTYIAIKYNGQDTEAACTWISAMAALLWGWKEFVSVACQFICLLAESHGLPDACLLLNLKTLNKE